MVLCLYMIMCMCVCVRLTNTFRQVNLSNSSVCSHFIVQKGLKKLWALTPKKKQIHIYYAKKIRNTKLIVFLALESAIKTNLFHHLLFHE